MKITNRFVIIVIVIVAACLRLFGLPDIPFTHDEFSALFRTGFGSFSELVEKGIKPDGHPAGVQVFLFYWIKLSGYREWLVKLPFLLMGVASVYLIYLISIKWYNETVGIIAASFMATMQYTVMYSQIARPYASGLFFTLLMVFSWSRLILNPERKFLRNLVLFTVFASVCTYNHHFSMLFAAVVGLSGIFLVKREYLARYLISGLIILIFYLPHLGILAAQLRTGGVEGWLSKPDAHFLPHYLYYLFNFSFPLLWLFIMIAATGIFMKGTPVKSYRSGLILFSLWFLIPLLAGYIYSIYVSAVLQYSVLIFSFPYLLLALTGHIGKQKPLVNLGLATVILIVGSGSLIFQRQHYTLFYNSPFEKILTDGSETKDKYPNTLSIIDSHKKITDYYIRKNNLNQEFIWLDQLDQVYSLDPFLAQAADSYDYLYLGCVSQNHPLTVPIIMDYFPTIVWQRNYAGGTTYLFSREKPLQTTSAEVLDFENAPAGSWTGIDGNKLVRSPDGTTCLLDSTTEWGPGYVNNLNNLAPWPNGYIDVSVKAFITEQAEEILLVTSLDQGDKNIHWSATPFSAFIKNDLEKPGWIKVHHAVKLSDIPARNKEITVKAFIWNKGRSTFQFDDFTVAGRKGNPLLYGLTQPF